MCIIKTKRRALTGTQPATTFVKSRNLASSTENYRSIKKKKKRIAGTSKCREKQRENVFPAEGATSSGAVGTQVGASSLSLRAECLAEKSYFCPPHEKDEYKKVSLYLLFLRIRHIYRYIPILGSF